MTRPVPPLLPAVVGLCAGIVAAGGGFSVWWALLPALLGAGLYLLRRYTLALSLLWLTAGLLTASLHTPAPFDPAGWDDAGLDSSTWDSAIGDSAGRDAPWRVLPRSPHTHPKENSPGSPAHAHQTTISPSTLAEQGSARCDFSALLDEVSETASGVQLVVNVDSAVSCPVAPFKALLTIRGDVPSFEPRQRLRFIATLRPVVAEPVSLPFERTYASRLMSRGIAATATVLTADLSCVAPPSGFRAALSRMGASFRRHIAWMPVSSETSSFLLATLAADDSMISAEARGRFSLSGTAHVLALSGMHVAIIAALLFLVLLPLNLLSRAKWRWPVALAALWLYALLVGAPVSVVRAVIMLSLIALAEILERRPFPLNSLCAAALVILCFDPAQLYSVGFQLSFLAVGGILLLSRPLNPFCRDGVQPPLFSEIVCVTLAATIATAPLVAFRFHIFPVWFLLSNLVMLLLLPPLMFGAAGLLLLNLCGFRAEPLGTALDLLYKAIAGALDAIGSLPLSALSDICLSPHTLIAVYTAILLLALGLNYPPLRRGLLSAALAVALLGVALQALQAPPLTRPAVFIPAERRETFLLLSHRDTLTAVSTLPPHLSQARRIAAQRWPEFLLRQGVDSVSLASPHGVSPLLVRRGCLVTAFGRRIVMLDGRPDSLPRGHVDYLVVAADLRSSLLPVVEALRPDTVVLASALSSRAASRASALLDSLSIPALRPPLTILP